MKILIADKLDSSAKLALEDIGHEVRESYGATSDDLEQHIQGIEVLVVRSTRVTDGALRAADRLSLIVRAGAGVDNIDVVAASDLGIHVCNVPGKNAAAVAELTFALLLAIDRHVVEGASDLRKGTWNKKEYSIAAGLMGKTIGIIGLGGVGLGVAERAKAFGLRVMGQRRGGRSPETEQRIRQIGIRLTDTVEELVAHSDIVSIHVPSNEHTVKLVDEELLRSFKDEAILINTSRGEIIDEPALIQAMNERGIRAGLDVFCDEPAFGETTITSALASHPSVVGSHHIGASTMQASKAIASGVIDAIAGFESGNPLNCVNEAPSGEGTSQVRVRHLDRVGVLASVLSALRAADLNVQYMDNRLFNGKKAAVASIEVVGAVPIGLYDELVSLEHVLGVSLLDKRAV
ncbi:MAG: hydroxyacid dehydrogenase [Actinobacteria bacterium]|nr:hydroxyacid dehydrogenase [Actinomycetota bacterium]|tara:strand:+ start:1925 stop:3139 length:1215 start_codon:yes stop_codon:yes gene_type:complete